MYIQPVYKSYNYILCMWVKYVLSASIYLQGYLSSHQRGDVCLKCQDHKCSTFKCHQRDNKINCHLIRRIRDDSADTIIVQLIDTVGELRLKTQSLQGTIDVPQSLPIWWRLSTIKVQLELEQDYELTIVASVCEIPSSSCGDHNLMPKLSDPYFKSRVN